MSERAVITDADRRAAKAWWRGEVRIMDPTEDLALAFAAYRIQARKEAIEEAARVADATQAYDDALQRAGGGMTTGQRIAAAIRALGEGVEPLTPAPE